MFATTQNEYKGYYYEMSGKTFAGEKFDPNNEEIVKIQSDGFNKLLGKASSYIYGAVSGIKIPNTKVSSVPNSNPNILNNETKFYCQKVNQKPLVIKEINEETYVSLQKDPIYRITYIGKYLNKSQNIDVAEKQIPGIKAFLEPL